jgi:cell division control protein 6
MKPGDILMEGETLFQNESVFTPAYVPKDFIHRDSEIGEIMLALKPGLRGVAAVNTLVYGPPGTGKTTAVKYAFEELKQASKKLLPVYINCEDISTPYGIFAKIYEAVYGLSPPSTGKPIEDVKEGLLQIEERGQRPRCGTGRTGPAGGRQDSRPGTGRFPEGPFHLRL